MPPTTAVSARLAAHHNAFLVDTCTIYKRAVNSGVESYPVYQTAVPCFFGEESGKTDPSLGLDAKANGYFIHLANTTTIDLDCQIGHGGHMYEIWNLEDDRTPLIYKKASLTRIDPS